jgi:D-glycerate 3-kinase
LAGARVTDALGPIEAAVRRRLGTGSRRPFVLGLCGSQGSGKSTVSAALEQGLAADGIGCATLSLDDLYKTRAARERLARAVHPLFATRGPPGTHDLDLAFDLLDALEQGRAARVPRFDKARDDRRPDADWDVAPADTQAVILEGWFVGARPQPAEALAEPINALEAEEDQAGRWRTFANVALAGDYQRLFARIDLLVLLAAPGFEIVRCWRGEQETKLRAEGRGGMSEAELDRFVQHYERLTRHILADMPGYADLVIRLDAERRVINR